MKLQLLCRAVVVLILGNYSYVYTQAFEPFETETETETETSKPSEDTVQLATDSTIVEEYSSDELKNKIKLFTKLQNTGIGICLAGAGAAIYGLSCATREAEEEKMISGSSLVFIGDGCIALIGGIVMSAIMSNKVKEYKSRLDKVSLNFDRRNRFTGLKMTCNF
jgi:hypothetical protein